MVTIFKDLYTTSTPFYKEIAFILERIKTGKSKDLVIAIRNEKNKEKRDALKIKLPAILFSGTFSNRNAKGLKEHSGYICLDFDKYESDKKMIADRKKFEKDEYTFSVFTSPSGNGLKVIVRIPPVVENHRDYFIALEKYYNSENFDIACKDVSRVCYESYDEKIYINTKSKEWNKFDEILGSSFIENSPIIVLEDENEIISRLIKWFDKNYSMTANRNTNLFILASAFNEFGVSQDSCKYYCQKFIQKDFTEKEIERTIRSAYSKVSAFRTKYFDDDKKVMQLRKDLKKGVGIDELKKQYKGIDVETILENTPTDIFWFITKNNKIGIDNFKYKTWLEQNGYYKYYPEGSESFILIRIENNIIDTVNEVKIKDFVLSFLLKQKEYDVYQYMTNLPKYFKEDFLNTIDIIDIRFKEDTKDNAYLYFKSNVVEVSLTGIKIIDYIDLDGFVWKKQIIDREYKESIFEDCVYNKFISLVADCEQVRYDTIVSVIGYLLHSHKTSANNKAIIINDETISDNPNGGSGKGLFCNALKFVKKVDTIDGKQFDFNKNFAYQTLNADTQVLVFDDVEKSFNFESLFSIITEGITIEKKNKDAIKIPVSRSPKIVITTNYTIGGVGGSFDRRKFEIEFSSYFNATHTPEQEFGGLLFDGWDDNEWNMFYSFMISCLRYYMENGLVKYEHKNLELRKLYKETATEFIEFMDDAMLIIGERVNKTDLFNRFITEYKDFNKWLKQKRFKIWLDTYANYKNYTTEHGTSLDGRWVMFKNK
jgi:hypothetical protein